MMNFMSDMKALNDYIMNFVTYVFVYAELRLEIHKLMHCWVGER